MDDGRSGEQRPSSVNQNFFLLHRREFMMWRIK
jgi:hypothetical protein